MKIMSKSRSRALIAAAVGFGLIATMAVASAPAYADTAPADPSNPATPTTVAADALPTPQINGVAWSQVVVGNTVYVAGKFTTARPAGAAAGVNTTPRNNLLAYNIETGQLLPNFAPNLNAQALAITASPDGSRIYVVGDFTSIDGQGYYRAAAFSTATNTVIPAFKPVLGSQGRSVSVTNSTVYIGGTFRTVNGAARNYVAAVNASNGATVPGWDANADLTVDAIAVLKDGSKVILGGRFAKLGGEDHYGLGAVSPTTGANLPWAAPAQVRNGGTKASITSLRATEDRVYGSGYVFGENSDGNLEGIFSADPASGEIQWVEDCHGDTYSTFSQGSAVYGAGHPHYCGNIGAFPQTEPWTMYYGFAFSKAATGTITPDPHGYYNWAGTPSPSLLNFFPTFIQGSFTGQGQATWSVSGNDKYVVYGGEFPFINGTAQQGLTRFAVSSIAPNKIAPNTNDDMIPQPISFKKGEVRISWLATHDRDNAQITYKLVRDGNVNAPVYQTTQASNFYTRPAMGFVDKGLAPGSSHTYRLYASDPFNNTISRLGPSVVVASTDSGGEYLAAVEADEPSSFWPLSEPSGTVGFDYVGMTDLQVRSGVSRGAAGPVTGTKASSFDGSGNGFAAKSVATASTNTFSAEAWVRTTSTSGGKIIGFGNSNTGNSGSYDRHVYMDNSGRIVFGVYPGSTQTVNSAASFNDGQWHHVVATLGSNGMRLFVDANQVGARSDVTTGQDYTGYWRVGGDNLGGWPAQPSSSYFAGDIANVAVYPGVLNRSSVIDHFVASGRTSPIAPAPTDTYGAAVFADEPDLYWRLGDTAGDVAKDSGPSKNDGRYDGNVSKGTAGALAGNSDQAATFSGGIVSSNAQFSNPSTYSLETWFSTQTTQGGKLIGFGNERAGLSGNYDRHVYMQDDGRLVFGTWTGQTNTVTSGSAYNDGGWHHMVATQSSAGMRLFVDGNLVGTNPQTSAQGYDGYWRIGGDNTWGSSSPYFAGNLDEVAVYSSALSTGDVESHYAIGAGAAPVNQAPTAAFASTATNLAVSFDASASSDPDGTITGYAWNFGDTGTASGATASHSYTDPGTYQVTLTVTDNSGATGQIVKPVTVTAPPPPANVAPTAAFTSSASGLSVSVNGSGSSDPDGTITGYGWNFGDTGTASGATASHSYTDPGTYQVTLTVTDNSGATGQIVKPVTVTAPPPATNVLAKDDFGRSLASGWGNADAGGAWTINGSASTFRVVNGVGQTTAAVGSTRTMALNSVSSTSSDSGLAVSLDQLPTGGGYYAALVGRQIGSANYALRVWIQSNGSVRLVTQQGATSINTTLIPGLTYTPGTELQARFQVVGTSPTTLRGKVWVSGQAEPANWQSTVTDATAALQASGSVGLQSYLFGTATGPITVNFDRYTSSAVQ